jgi:hypothetical protein
MDWLLILFLFFVITVITAALFCGWAVWAILRFVIRALTGAAPDRPSIAGNNNGNSNGNLPGMSMASLPPTTALNTIRCARQGCWAHNPSTARFCRRCGAALTSAEPVLVRRAAVW